MRVCSCTGGVNNQVALMVDVQRFSPWFFNCFSLVFQMFSLVVQWFFYIHGLLLGFQ